MALNLELSDAWLWRAVGGVVLAVDRLYSLYMVSAPPYFPTPSDGPPSIRQNKQKRDQKEQNEHQHRRKEKKKKKKTRATVPKERKKNKERKRNEAPVAALLEQPEPEHLIPILHRQFPLRP
jgi:hypothetical protein